MVTDLFILKINILFNRLKKLFGDRSNIEPLIENYTFGRLLNHNFMIYMTNTNLTTSRV